MTITAVESGPFQDPISRFSPLFDRNAILLTPRETINIRQAISTTSFSSEDAERLLEHILSQADRAHQGYDVELYPLKHTTLATPTSARTRIGISAAEGNTGTLAYWITEARAKGFSITSEDIATSFATVYQSWADIDQELLQQKRQDDTELVESAVHNRLVNITRVAVLSKAKNSLQPQRRRHTAN